MGGHVRKVVSVPLATTTALAPVVVPVAVKGAALSPVERLIRLVTRTPLANVAVVSLLLLGLQRARRRLRRKRTPRRAVRVSASLQEPRAPDGGVVEEWNDVTAVAASGDAVPQPPLPLLLQLIKVAVRCDAATLMRFLFHPESPYFADRAAACRYQNLVLGPWRRREDGDKVEHTRDVYYETPLNSPIGPAYAHVTEGQRLGVTPWGFVAHVSAHNPNVPFGTRFHTSLRLVAWDLPGGRCLFSVSAQVVFTGPTGLLRGMIAGSTHAGLKATYTDVLRLVSQAFGVDAAPADADAAPSLTRPPPHHRPAPVGLRALVPSAGGGAGGRASREVIQGRGAALGVAAAAAAASSASPSASGERAAPPDADEPPHAVAGKVAARPPPPMPPATLTSATSTTLVLLCAALVTYLTLYGLMPAVAPDLRLVLQLTTAWFTQYGLFPVPGVPFPGRLGDAVPAAGAL